MIRALIQGTTLRIPWLTWPDWLSLRREGAPQSGPVERKTAPRKVLLYVGVIGSAGTWLLVQSIFELVHKGFPQANSALPLLVLACISPLIPIRTSAKHAKYDLKPAFLFAAVIALPPDWLVPIIFMGFALFGLFGNPQRRVLEPAFNFGQESIAFSLAAWVRRTIEPGPVSLRSPSELLAAGTAIAVFMVVQILLVTMIVVLYRRVSWREAESVSSSNIISDLLLLWLGIIIGVVWQLSGWSVILALVPLVGLYLALQFSQDVSHLKEVERLKTSLVANVSHELRSPLASIKLYGELLQSHLDTENPNMRQELLQVMGQQTDRLVDLINDLLDMSRLESGHRKVNKMLIDLGPLIEEVLDLFVVQMKARGLTLVKEIQPNLPSVMADQELLFIIFKNLISNAIKYNRPEGRIEVSAYAQENWLEFSVKDSGIGIPASALPHIFDKFYRVSTTSESGIVGSGLGLAMVKEAIDLHDGRVEVISEPGAGAQFKVRLPLVA